MIFGLFRRTPRDSSIALLYGAIVAQARAEAFYRDLCVPDTVNGRFEMIVLHLLLLLRRLEREGEAGRALGQRLFDHFCEDMDANLREMGVGDLSVPREMRGFGEAFYGRRQAYAEALAGPERDMLVTALLRNVYGDKSDAMTGAKRLAAYVWQADAVLAGQGMAALCRGELELHLVVKREAINHCDDGKDDQAPSAT
jgi:cytochrome b pre-mRNA-processing protein 3